MADLSPEVSKSILEPARALKNVSYGFSLEISGYLWEIGDYWKFFVPGTKGGFYRDLHSVPPMCIQFTIFLIPLIPLRVQDFWTRLFRSRYWRIFQTQDLGKLEDPLYCRTSIGVVVGPCFPR